MITKGMKNTTRYAIFWYNRIIVLYLKENFQYFSNCGYNFTMKPNDIIEILNSKLRCLLLPDAVEAVYLYGSLVRGRLRADSDIDIALLVAYGIDDMEKLEVIAKIEAIFTSLLKEMGFQQEVSILDLHGRYLSVELQYKVVTEGIPVYTKDLLKRLEFENSVKREYFDFSPYLRSLRERRYGHLLPKA